LAFYCGKRNKVIDKNLFKIDDLKSVVLLGGEKYLDKIIKINKNLKLNTEVISCSDQIKEFNLKKNTIKFDNLDNNFKKYLLKKYNFDKTLFISLGARWIFGKDTIKNFFKNKLINFHGARLPYDSGGGGHSWKIMRNDRIDSQLVHIVDEGIDSGPILFSKSTILSRDVVLPGEIEDYRVKKFLEFYEDFLKLIKNKKVFIKKYQPKYLGRYNPRLNTKINGWIDWKLNSFELINFINAFENPYIGASTLINNKKVYIKKAQLHGGDSSNHAFMTGLISRHDGDWLIVSTVDKYSLIIEVINDVNGKNILKSLKAGDRFFTPQKNLESAKSVRIKYGTRGLKK